jgi:NAD(P)-dependent dehydrogenase (short-subunit alcohol dehydrogenase family)
MICGAAGNFLVPTEKLSPNGFKTVVDIDLLGSFNAARLAFDQLKRTKGSIIFITAPMAYVTYSHQAHVCAAKAGIESLMKNLALEWGVYGIRSNSIIPGLVQGTHGLDLIVGEGGSMTDHIPLRRLGSIEEIGHAALFLASPMAAYITGTTLWVDGGQALPGSGFFNVNSSNHFAASQAKSR